MEHFYQPITGWFTFFRLYADMVAKYPSGSDFVEVGTYEGKSFAYLVVEAINAGKEINMSAVDSFTFTDEHCGDNILDVFKRNMSPVEGKYNIIKGQSDESASQFEDGSLDFVFLDADHVYARVKGDILAWLPKIKKGGILAGHDYEPQHPGVKQAVDEIFGDDWNKEYLDELCWVKNIE